MKDVKEFVKSLVKIELIEDESAYGHYPFQLFVEKVDGKFEICAMALDGGVHLYYQKVRKYLMEGATRIFLSLDFPRGGDIESDFVAVFSIIGDEVKVFAIPYNPKDGKVSKKIYKGYQLDAILAEFKNHAL